MSSIPAKRLKETSSSPSAVEASNQDSSYWKDIQTEPRILDLVQKLFDCIVVQ